MARIRSIKPDFWTDEKIVELDIAARLFFVGSWNFADDNGNLQRSAKKLKMQIFPADAIDCEPIIHALIAHGLLIEYSVNGEKYLHIKGFRKHQVINRPSKTGLPTLSDADPAGVLTEDSLTEGKGVGEEKERIKHPPIPPKGGEDVAEAMPVKAKRSAIGLPAFLQDCRKQGVKPIPEGDAVFAYADKVGIPLEFLRLHWLEFKTRYSDPDAKRYKDWRAVYRKSVRGNWLKLWFFAPDGSVALTTVGEQARRSNGEAA